MAPADTTTPSSAPADDATDGDRPAPDSVAERSSRRATVKVVLATVLLALLWPIMWSVGEGSTDALLGAGVEGPARQRIEQDIPDLFELRGIGHDGQQFYVIARHPFDPDAAGDAVDPHAYRYRRILFPLAARVLALTGGRAMIGAFLALSLVGVALGAWALRRLPGGPPWLPLVAAFSPAAIASLTLSLADGLAAGLGMAAIAAATRHRYATAILLVTAAGLTRETLLIAALGMALVPGMPRAWRVASVLVPSAVLGAWMVRLAIQTDTSLLAAGNDQVALPLVGYFSGHTDAATFLMSGLAALLLAAGGWRVRHSAPQVAVVLALQLVLLLCVSELVAFTWIGAVRTAAPMLPLAIWAVTTGRRSDDGRDDPVPTPA